MKGTPKMKTVMPTKADDPSNFEILARHRFELALRHFYVVTARISRGERVSSADTLESDRIFQAATESLIKMRARLNDAKKSEAGRSEYDALDVEDARLKIGSLLDRIRFSQASDDLS